jgi:cobalt/nickel transport system permease protein
MCLNHLSAHSRLRARHPMEGLAIGGGGLLVAILLTDLRLLSVLATAMILATFAIARPPAKLYIGLVLSTLPFLAMASMALLVSIEGAGLRLVWDAWPMALLVGVRAFTCGLCSLFLGFSHPPESWVYLLGRAPLPRDLVDLLSYAFKSIVVFVDRAWHMHLAHQARLGHVTWRSSLRSTGLLAANLWRQSFHDISNWHRGIGARAGTGSLRTLSFLPQPSRRILGLSGLVYFTTIVVARLTLPGGGS